MLNSRGWIVVCLLAVSAVAPGAIRVERVDDGFTVEGAHFALDIDLAKGGEISGLRLHDGSAWNPVLDSATFPALTFIGENSVYALSNAAGAASQILAQNPDMLIIETSAFPQDADGAPCPAKVTLRYEIHSEGAVFIDIECALNQSALALTRATMALTPSRGIVEGPHFRTDNLGKQGGGFPSARIAFGVNPAKTFTNEIEAVVEYRSPMFGETGHERKDGGVLWILGDAEAAVPLAAPFTYRNRVALGLGAAATGKPRSNLVGQRVYHWVNRLDQDNWYPTNEQIDSMVEQHATLLVLHQYWMLQSGRNGNPHADYTVVRDHDEMVRTFDYAHAKGLRVGLYMRGIEMYGLATGFFEKYCKRGWDGIYTDWHGSLAISWHEQQYDPDEPLGDTHFSDDGSYVPAREYFLFTKRQRELVGPGGFLIGHQGSFNAGVLANLCFDAYLPGESGTDRRMLSDLAEAGYKGMLGGGVCMPWTLDLPLYRNAEGAARMAAWGLYPHLVVGIESRQKENVTFTLDPADAEYRFVLPYWRLLAAIDVERATVFNLPSHNVTAMRMSNDAFAGLVYKVDSSEYLVVVANLGADAASCDIELDAAVLGLDGDYRATRVDAETGAREPAAMSATALTTGVLPQWGIEGYLLTRP